MCVVRDPEERCVTLQEALGVSSAASFWAPLCNNQEHTDSQAAGRECHCEYFMLLGGVKVL